MRVGLECVAGKGNIADLQQFRGRKERHVGRIVIERVHHTPFVHGYYLEARALGFNGAGQPRRPSANYQYVEFVAFSGTWLPHHFFVAHDGYFHGQTISF